MIASSSIEPDVELRDFLRAQNIRVGLSGGGSELVTVYGDWERSTNDLPNDFIVIYKIAKKRGVWYVYVSDPAAGLLKYTEEQFRKSWLEVKGEDGHADQGILLLIETTPRFYEQRDGDGKDGGRFTLARLAEYLRPHRHSLVQLVLAMIAASLLSLILPFITQSVVDQGVSLGRLDFV